MALETLKSDDPNHKMSAISFLRETGYKSEANMRFDRLLKEIMQMEDRAESAYALMEIMGLLNIWKWKQEFQRVYDLFMTQIKKVENSKDRDQLLFDVVQRGLGMENKEKIQEIIPLIRDLKILAQCQRELADSLKMDGKEEEAVQTLSGIGGGKKIPNLSELVYSIRDPKELEWLAGEVLKMV
jgi:hypothetical protein